MVFLTPAKVDYKAVVKAIWSYKRIYAIVLFSTAVLSSLLIICVPRYYTCSIKLAPEYDANVGNSISSLASSVGFDIGGTPSTDAISPTLYPDLIGSRDFQISLFNIQVKNLDGSINTSYYNYLRKNQKEAWWTKFMSYIGTKILPSSKEQRGTDKSVGFNSFRLTKAELDVAEQIHSNVKCTVDKKTDVISLSLTDQDPLICATMIDSIRMKLQTFITNYRTNKARTDMEYYRRLMIEAKRDYEQLRQRYGGYSDANTDVLLRSYQLKTEELENEMQLKYNTYIGMSTQYQAAKAKVQQKTPAFTTLQGATVPIKPTGPKRMSFVLVMVFLSFMGTTVYVLRQIVK